MDKNNRVKKIVKAPLFSRTFGAVIDLVITIFVGAGIFLGISNIASNINWIKAYKDDYNQTVVDSGLMQMKNKELAQYEYTSYEEYQTLFYNFYHGFYANETQNNYDVYWFNVFIYGQDDALKQFEEKDLAARPALVRNIGKTYFTYRLDENSEPLFNEFALPVASENGTIAIDDTTKKQLKNYFYVSDEEAESNLQASQYKFIYYYALADLTSLSKLQNDYNRFALFSTTLPLVIAIFITFMIFYFVIPLFFKNGETIGKKVMHTCLVNKIGYQYSRLQLIPRFLFPTFLIMAVVFLMGFSMWSLLIVSASILISYLFVVFSKDNKALHDLFAGTLVIDARESTWFKNINEEEQIQKDVDTYVESVKNNQEPLNDDSIIYTNPHFKDKK